MTFAARHRRIFGRMRWRSPGDPLTAGFDALGDEPLPFEGSAGTWIDGRGFSTGPKDEDKPGGVVAVVGLRFEARIIASPAVRAVLLGSELSALSGALFPSDRGVISFGICGGLAPQLRAGDCVIASFVSDGERRWPTDKAWTSRLAKLIPNAIVAPALGVDAPVFEVEDKKRLFEAHGTVAVDMESHHAARLASVHGVPFVSIRAVADDARCPVVESAMAGRRADGSVSAAGVLTTLGARPSEIVPLIRLAARASSARSTLMRIRPLLAEALRSAQAV